MIKDRNAEFPRIRNRARQDLKEMRVNHLTVVEEGPDYVNPHGSRFTQWYCRCDCGNMCLKRTTALLSGKAISCGCARSTSIKDKNVKDMTNQKFGRWTVLRRDENYTKDRIVHWICECECGTIRSVSGKSLRNGDSTSCGCAKIEHLTKIRDLTNQEFGHLTVVTASPNQYKYNRNNKMWHCLCKCGNYVDIRESDLLNGSVSSCGCVGKSLNEEYLEEILDELKIPYDREVVFDDCVGKTGKPLRFDFCVHYDDDVYIELNGSQHYVISDYFGGVDAFVYQQQLDVVKYTYMLNNGHTLRVLDCSNRPSKSVLKALFLQEDFVDVNSLSMDKPDLENSSSRNISRIARYFNFDEFYKNELYLWNQNEVYRDDTPLQDYLIANRVKYLNKSADKLTDIELLRGFTIAGIHKGYTVFDNKLMLSILDSYDINSVYDPCAGWGERMLTCYFKDIEYLGLDVNKSLSKGYLNMRVAMPMYNQYFAIGDAAKFHSNRHFDAVITCPPYWNTESYSDNGVENLGYDEFLEWWNNVVVSSLSATPKYFCFQINQKYKIDMMSIVENNGFVLKDELLFKTNKSSHFTKVNGKDTKKEYESMLVFERV